MFEQIQIPLDEMNIFEREEKYQPILKETLILSTLGFVHEGGRENQHQLMVTFKNIWIGKKKCIPLDKVQSVGRSHSHPEIVIITTKEIDNLRISTTSVERCQYLVSALAYIWNSKGFSLPLYTIKQSNLGYFERSSADKKRGHQVSLSHYPRIDLSYQKPITQHNIFGKADTRKMKIVKQIQIQVVDSHCVLYLAQIDSKFYFYHLLTKDQNYIKLLSQHQNHPKIQSMIYAKITELKLQVLFQHGQSIRGHNSPAFFIQLWHLYDIAKQSHPECVITTDSFLISDEKVMLREFRYKFLNEAEQIQKFKYEISGPASKFSQKLYNLGLILYELTFGMCLFNHESLETLIYIKLSMNKIPYPKYLSIHASPILKDFIDSCLCNKFSSEAQLFNHTWLKNASKLL